MSTISENIRKFRLDKNLKQSELGSLIGKAPSVIANWEAETNRPDVDSIRKMCEIFDIDANKFFGWQAEIPTPSPFPQSPPIPDELAASWEQLNVDGQAKVAEYAQDLVTGGRYLKKNDTEVGKIG